jgi:hypothetical protein
MKHRTQLPSHIDHGMKLAKQKIQQSLLLPTVGCKLKLGLGTDIASGISPAEGALDVTGAMHGRGVSYM